MSDINKPEYLDDTDPEKNYNFYRQDHGGIVTEESGLADRLLTNNDLYRSMKGDWKRTNWNKGNNIKVTTGRQDGKFYITREQQNTEAIKQHCKEYRTAAEHGTLMDGLAPIGEDGKLQFKWMELPIVISIRISDQYFGGMPWNAIKTDRHLKAQFYRVVQQEYPEYICYPGGKLPIPVAVSYPNRTG